MGCFYKCTDIFGYKQIANIMKDTKMLKVSNNINTYTEYLAKNRKKQKKASLQEEFF